MYEDNVQVLLPCSLRGLELGLSIIAVHSCDNLLNCPLSEGLSHKMSHDLRYTQEVDNMDANKCIIPANFMNVQHLVRPELV